MYQDDLEKLNREQLQVVEKCKENLLVLAPAGTGKTKVIALRTVRLLKEGYAPESLLCLTFTNKAAKEMRDRILMYAPEEGSKLLIKTFHSFCYHLICHEKSASHFSFPCTIIDESDALDIVQKIIRQNGIDDESLYYPMLMSFIENIKRHALTFPLAERYQWGQVMSSYLSGLDQKYGKSDQFIRRFGPKIFNTYNRYLKENNCVDFMDLIVEAMYLLEQDEIREKWQKQFKVIQIDEMQDTSVREYELIRLLAQGGQLSLYGDFNQTIYEWRGSNPKGMLAAYEVDFSPEVVKLLVNYRSTQILLKAANDYIKSSQLYPSHCQPHAAVFGEPITLLEATTPQEEIDFLVKKIKQRSQTGVRPAILTRTNGHAKDISEALTKANIACTVIEDIKLFRRKEVKGLLAFFEYAINERNGNALQKIAEHPYMNMPIWLIKQLKEAKSCYMYLHDWFRIDSRDPYSELEGAFKENRIVVLDVESTGLSTTQDEIVQIAAIRYGEKGVCETLDVLVKPTRKVGDSFKVHGFSDEKLAAEGLPPKEALAQLFHFVQGSVIVGHNVNYDMQIINSMLTRLKMTRISGLQIYDTLDLSYKVYPKLPNHKLDTLSQLIVTDVKPTHNAMQDILATSEVLKHLLEKLLEKKQERFEKIEAYYCYVEEYKAKLKVISQFIQTHTPEESIIFLMNDCELKQYYTKEEKQHIRSFYRIVRALEEPDLSYQDQIINLLTFSALHYSEIEQSDLFKDSIPVITVHQAKGLEFEEVYVAGCNEGVFPSYRSIKDNHLTEELRLFYVAMTRAKKKLYLSYHLGKKKSIFLDYIGDTYKIVNRYSE